MYSTEETAVQVLCWFSGLLSSLGRSYFRKRVLHCMLDGSPDVKQIELAGLEVCFSSA